MAPNARALFSQGKVLNPGEETWLSGNEVMQQTGISKTDLIRFIQLRVLPKSMMRVSAVGPGGTRRKSYFSASILGHVAMLKRLRDEGHSVEEIASEMREAAKGSAPLPDPSLPQTPSRAPSSAEKAKQTVPEQLHLLADTIATSAFFVNRDLHIGWIMVDPGDRLSATVDAEMANDPSGTVFDIMLRASLKELVFNWQPLFSFIYRFLQKTTPPDTFKRFAPTISLNLDKTVLEDEPVPDNEKTGPIDSCPILIEGDGGRIQGKRFYGIAVAEGTLFIMDEDRWQEAHPGKWADETDHHAEADSASRKRPFSVLSARLDDSRRIVETLLPETYFQLMTRIWDESERVLQSYGGQLAKRSGTELQYIIPRHADTDPAYDAICCAVALKQKMRDIEASLKADGGWFSNIRLNIGISSGSDHLQTEDLTTSMAFMLPGAAADQAFHLSAIAHGGAIWITKSAFSHLTPQQMKRITFGIYRDDKLIPNIFAQVSDLPHAPDAPPLGRGIRSLSVTRIIDLQSEPAS